MAAKNLTVPPLTAKDLSRFWARVDVRGTDECWPWTAGRNGRGYGRFNLRGKMYSAHRVAWVIANGSVPEAMCIRHLACDNPPCCNPAHLAVGTDADNMADMKAKQRAPTGERHGRRTQPEATARGEKGGRAKLTATDVLAIRERYATGEMTQKALAQEYAVGPTLIWSIVHGVIWKHVGGPCSARSPRPRLTQAQVRQIRLRHENGNTSCAKLATEYAVSERNIRRIVRGTTWGDVS